MCDSPRLAAPASSVPEPSSGPPASPSSRPPHEWWGAAPPCSLLSSESGVERRSADSTQENPTIELASPADGAAAIVVESSTTPPAGRYWVGDEIGRGGAGVVHEGWDAQLKRRIAVKVLLPDHRDKPAAVRRFLDEARIASRLQHPGVVAIHELGRSPDGRPFFVMSLVQGETLDRILARRANPVDDQPQLLRAFLQVCQTVAYAHHQGVIHRDLKPANIMAGRFGVVKVMDWGLAKVLGEPDESFAFATASPGAAPGDASPPHGTQAGTVFGTPAYLPPEQARGEIDRVDERADVFGLGAILCEILTGRPPYTGADGHEVYQKAAAALIGEALARVNACRASLDLVDLTRRCLSPNPDDRPADAGAVVELISAHLESHQRRAEQDLVRFFDLSMDLFCIASTDGYFLRVNENFPRVLGYSAAELTSRPYVDFVHPDDRERTGVETIRLAGGAPCIQFTNRYRHADGRYIWLEWSAQAVPEERAIYAVARDVTDRVEREDVHRRIERARDHLADVVNSADLAIISTSRSGEILSWNAGATRLFGYRADEALGRSIEILVPPEGAAEAAAVLDRLVRGDRVAHYEAVRRRADGTRIAVSLTVSPVKDDQGRVIGASKILRDITDRKAAEQARSESEARLRAVVDQTVDAIVTLDAHGTIESWNRAAEQMFGYSAAEMLGRHVSSLTTSSPRAPCDERPGDGPIDPFAHTVGRTRELEAIRKDGRTFPIELTVGEAYVAGRPLYTGVLRDISDRKRLECEAAVRLQAAGFVSAAGSTLTRGTSLTESLQKFAALAVAHLQVDCAQVWTLDKSRGELELQAHAGVDSAAPPRTRIRLGEGRIGRIARERRACVVDATSDADAEDRSGTSPLPVFAGHPLVVDDCVAGVTVMLARRPFSDAILETLRCAADNLALAVRHRQLVDELERLRTTSGPPNP